MADAVVEVRVVRGEDRCCTCGNAKLLARLDELERTVKRSHVAQTDLLKRLLRIAMQPPTPAPQVPGSFQVHVHPPEPE